MSANGLGDFLRETRESVAPTDVGLPHGPRRRTPGLRRAELATLAGVSVDYLARLEQGRDRHPSAELLGALADVLLLSSTERIHLRHLSKLASGGSGLCPGAAHPPARAVRPTVQALLDRMDSGPAVLLNRVSDVLACTTGYQRLAGPIGLLDAEEPNLVRFAFADERARTVFPEWDRVADDHARRLRFGGADCQDPHMAHLVEELMVVAGPAFTERMRTASFLPARTGVERWTHPDVGELRLAYETLELPDGDHQRIVVYLPEDEGTSAALAHLAEQRPGAMRAVSG